MNAFRKKMTSVLFWIALFLGAPAFAHAETCDPIAVSVTTTPTPPQTSVAWRYFERIVKERKKETDLVFVGDSLFELWGEDIDTDFPGKTVWNFAVGGDRTQNNIWRLENMDPTPIKPKDVVLLIGTNNFNATKAGACEIAIGAETIIDKIKAFWPESYVFVVGVPPRGADFRQFDEIRLDLNKRLQEYTKKSDKMVYVDLGDVPFTCGNYGKPGLDPTALKCQPEIAYRCENYRTDGLHFERPGYVYMRKALSEASVAALGYDRFAATN